MENPQEEPLQETIEEAAERLQKDKYGIFISKDADVKGQLVIDTAKAAFLSGMIEGANYQAERMYSEEDIKLAWKDGRNGISVVGGFPFTNTRFTHHSFTKWFEQFKKKQYELQ